MAQFMDLDDGSISIVIRNKDKQEIGAFSFWPTDTGILERYDKVVEALSAIKMPENADDVENGAAAVVEADNLIRKQFNYLLNGNVSEGIFAKCAPLTLTGNGDFYFENVMSGIAGLIEQHMGKRVKDKLAKIKAATAKYGKKK